MEITKSLFHSTFYGNKVFHICHIFHFVIWFIYDGDSCIHIVKHIQLVFVLFVSSTPWLNLGWQHSDVQTGVLQLMLTGWTGSKKKCCCWLNVKDRWFIQSTFKYLFFFSKGLLFSHASFGLFISWIPKIHLADFWRCSIWRAMLTATTRISHFSWMCQNPAAKKSWLGFGYLKTEMKK